MERVRPNVDSEPLELEHGTVSPGNTLVNLETGRPLYEVVDTQQGGGSGWPDGTIIQSATRPDGVNFVTAEKFNEWLRNPKYSI